MAPAAAWQRGEEEHAAEERKTKWHSRLRCRHVRNGYTLCCAPQPPIPRPAMPAILQDASTRPLSSAARDAPTPSALSTWRGVLAQRSISSHHSTLSMTCIPRKAAGQAASGNRYMASLGMHPPQPAQPASAPYSLLWLLSAVPPLLVPPMLEPCLGDPSNSADLSLCCQTLNPSSTL